MKIKFVDRNSDLVSKVAALGIQSVCADYFEEASRTPKAVLMTASNPQWTFGGGIDAAFHKHYPELVESKMRRKEWMERRKNICFCVTVDSNLKANEGLVQRAIGFALRRTEPGETLLIHGAGTGIGGLSHERFLAALRDALRPYKLVK